MGIKTNVELHYKTNAGIDWEEDISLTQICADYALFGSNIESIYIGTVANYKTALHCDRLDYYVGADDDTMTTLPVKHRECFYCSGLN